MKRTQTRQIPLSEASKTGFGGGALWYVFPSQNRTIRFAPPLAAFPFRVPPDVGLAPSAAWSPPPLPPPYALGPLAPTSLGRPLPEPCQKSQGGWGEEGGRGQGGNGVWLEGRVLQLQWGMGGDPPNTSWGQTHIWGLRFPIENGARKGELKLLARLKISSEIFVQDSGAYREIGTSSSQKYPQYCWEFHGQL